jgi:DNA-binding NtrC family response regulator
MKTRILFVDDEPLVLQGLQRMLRGSRHEVGHGIRHQRAGGPHAPRGTTPSTSSVSDMRMPGMDGAQLLTMRSCGVIHAPRASSSPDNADRELIMRGLDAIHQFMTKPCDMETLRSTIQRAHTLQETLRTEGLRRLIGQIEQLPSLPKLYTKSLTCSVRLKSTPPPWVPWSPATSP